MRLSFAPAAVSSEQPIQASAQGRSHRTLRPEMQPSPFYLSKNLAATHHDRQPSTSTVCAERWCNRQTPRRHCCHSAGAGMVRSFRRAARCLERLWNKPVKPQSAKSTTRLHFQNSARTPMEASVGIVEEFQDERWRARQNARTKLDGDMLTRPIASMNIRSLMSSSAVTLVTGAAVWCNLHWRRRILFELSWLSYLKSHVGDQSW